MIIPVHHSNRVLLWRLNNTTTPKCILILYSTPLNQFKVAYTSLGSIHLHFNPFTILKGDAFYIGRQYNDNYIMVAALWSSMRLLWPQWLVKLAVWLSWETEVVFTAAPLFSKELLYVQLVLPLMWFGLSLILTLDNKKKLFFWGWTGSLACWGRKVKVKIVIFDIDVYTLILIQKSDFTCRLKKYDYFFCLVFLLPFPAIICHIKLPLKW